MAATLAEILAYVAGLVVRVTAIQVFFAWLQRIIGGSGAPIAEGSLLQELFTMYHSVLAQGALLANGTYGLAAAHTERQAILAAIGGIPAPPTPPPVGDIVAGVWGETDIYSDSESLTYGEEIANAHRWASLMVKGGSVPATHAAFFNISYPPPSPDSIPTDYTKPEPDWSDIRPSDTLISWLTRTAPSFTWSDDFTGSAIIGYLTALPEYEAPHYTARLSPHEWERVYGARAGVPPIWPGAGYAVDGAPVVVVASQQIAGPMHGIHVTIDAVNAGTGKQIVDVHTNYLWAGWVAFVSDLGEVEAIQYLNFDAADYCPKSMAKASSVLIWLTRASQITVIPWTLA